MKKISKQYVLIILFIIIKLTIIDNINLLEKDFYKNIKLIKNPDSYITLVNKNNQLEADYIPNDLELINNSYAHDNKLLRLEAKNMFERLSNQAKKKGYIITAVSTYRDYNYQKNLFNHYVKEKGLFYAEKASARPGHSEHQTGLAVDVEGENHDYNLFNESRSYNWMINNAHKFGFILRYPKGKENITGFKFEPWHYRYVGLLTAKIIYENNLTLEEYYLKYWHEKNR